MKTWIEQKQNNKCKNLASLLSTSTFLIPEIHLKLFYMKLKKHNENLSMYLSFLLGRYRFLIRNGFIPRHEFLKTGYQEKKLNLKRVDFVPYAEDWAELKCLKTFLNRSMAWIFIALLLLDSLDLDRNLPKSFVSLVVPKISGIRFEVNVIFSRKQLIYMRVLQMTRDRKGKRPG